MRDLCPCPGESLSSYKKVRTWFSIRVLLPQVNNGNGFWARIMHIVQEVCHGSGLGCCRCWRGDSSPRRPCVHCRYLCWAKGNNRLTGGTNTRYAGGALPRTRQTRSRALTTAILHPPAT